MIDLDEFALAKLAREIAMNIRPAAVILQDFGLTETAFYEITKNPFFQRARDQFALEWNSMLTTNERVKLISAYALEQALPRLTKRMMGDEPLAAAADVAKLFSRNAGLGEARADGKSNERFQITINLGADKEVYDKAIAIEGSTERQAVAAMPGMAITAAHVAVKTASATPDDRPPWEEDTNGQEKLDGGSREEAGRAAPLAGRTAGGENPGGEDRESRALQQPDAAAASRAGEDLRQTPAVTLEDGRERPVVGARPNAKWAPRDATCKVEGCNNPSNIPGAARGFCKRHYHMVRNAKVQERKARRIAEAKRNAAPLATDE